MSNISPNSPQASTSDGSLALQQQRASELNSLFLFLIESCINHSLAEEQQSLAQYIEPLFTTAAEINPSTYSFLAPHFTTPLKHSERSKIVRKDETPKSKRAKSVVKKRKSKLSSTPSSSTSTKDATSNPAKISPSSKSCSAITSQDDILQRLLKAVELSADDLTTILLCRLLQGYITYCKVAVNQKRLRRMVRLDGANYCLRAMRTNMGDSNPSPVRILAIDALAKTLMVISAKDRKLMLKVRISGLLSLLANRIMEADRLFTTVVLLRLTSRCLRSPRNAQIIGREKRFAERFVALLNAFSASMDLSAVPSSMITVRSSASCSSIATASSASPSASFSFMEIPSVSALLYCKTNSHKEELVGAEKMARLIEILFFAAKNKHNKSQLLENQAVCVLKTIFENHFERRHLDTIHLEISLIALATIRQFSKTKKGKEQLKELFILSMCEKYIGLLADDRRRLANRPKTLALYSQLQDSLCALCLRCLPQIPFPIEKRTFPLKYSLPNLPSSSNLQQQTTSSAVKQRVPSPQKLKTLKHSTPTPTKENAKFVNTIDEGGSSDDGVCDEEEEDSLFIFNTTGDGASGSILEANAINCSDDEDECAASNLTEEKVDPVYLISNYGRQTLSKLKSTYQEHFIELEQDAITTGDSSPKLRKTAVGTFSDNRLSFGLPVLSSSYLSLDSASEDGNLENLYQSIIMSSARNTKSVGKFVKVAYPELVNVGDIVVDAQMLLPSSDSMREMIMNEIAKSRLQDLFQRRVVYDLDTLIAKNKNAGSNSLLSNNDLSEIGRMDCETPHLKFESRFESGNLRKAIQVSSNHYELILSPDINALRPHYQWFYFEVSNNEANVQYTFEIINCLKNSSMFSRGMQPVLFSVTDASQGNPGWVRASSSVCYYRNLYTNVEDNADEKAKSTPARNLRSNTQSQQTAGTADSDDGSKKGKKSDNGNCDTKSYFSLRFTLTFRHAADVCYIAYHFPYTYSYLNTTLEYLLSKVSRNTSNVYFRSGFLTKTLAGNPVRVITITAPGSVRELREREIVLFSARVHPGESNSSWIMHGILKFLTSDSSVAAKARDLFIFKIVPMLNPDGVINGSHRCSLAGTDLNRVWNSSTVDLHPTIFHTKGLIQYMVEVSKKCPFVFVDLHGHSRRSNIFMFGNNPEESWRASDHSSEQNFQFLALPEILEKVSPGFNLSDCRFSITKAKEFSARIAMWRQFGLERAYTMEATYCGFDAGRYIGKQITTANLMEMGMNLCEAIVLLKNAEDNHASPNYEALNRSIHPTPTTPSTPQIQSLANQHSTPTRGSHSSRPSSKRSVFQSFPAKSTTSKSLTGRSSSSTSSPNVSLEASGSRIVPTAKKPTSNSPQVSSTTKNSNN